MKPLRITFIRHGESVGNVNPQAHATIPDHRLDLTALGRQQAEAAGRSFAATLKGDRVAVYCSTFARTRQTFESFRTGLPSNCIHSIKEDLRLREQEWGHLRPVRATRKIERERDAFGPLYFRIPDGESGADVYDRCSGFLDTLHRDFAKKDFPRRVLIVTHGMTLRILIMRWLHLSPEEFHRMKNPKNCEMFDLLLGRNRKYSLAHRFPTKDLRLKRPGVLALPELAA